MIFSSHSPSSPTIAGRRSSSGRLSVQCLSDLNQMSFDTLLSSSAIPSSSSPSSTSTPTSTSTTNVAAFPANVRGMQGLGMAPGSPGFIAGLPDTPGLQSAYHDRKPPSVDPVESIDYDYHPRTLDGSENSLPGSFASPSPAITTAATMTNTTTTTSNRRFTSPSRFGSPSSPVVRSSAYSYSTNGPLTPLTPSNVPNAPSLTQESQFHWNDPSPRKKMESILIYEPDSPRVRRLFASPLATPRTLHSRNSSLVISHSIDTDREREEGRADLFSL